MKRHIQTGGVRHWYSEDLVELQSETMDVLEGFLSEFGEVIVSGCEITRSAQQWDITPGIVMLRGKGPNGEAVHKAAAFEGARVDALPVYLTLSCQERTRPDSGGDIIVGYDYKAVMSTAQPSTGSYLEITESGGVRISDLIEAAPDQSQEGQEQGFDYIVDSDEKLRALDGNASARNVLIKQGTWYCDGQIVLLPNIETVKGEPGSKLIFTVDMAGGDYNTTLSVITGLEEDGKLSISGLDIEVRGAVNEGQMAVCANLYNIHDCNIRLELEYVGPYSAIVAGFKDCRQLDNCKVSSYDTPGGRYNASKLCAFLQCESVTGCTAQVEITDLENPTIRIPFYGFESCRRLFSCGVYYLDESRSSTLMEGYGFYYCYFMDNCEVINYTSNGFSGFGYSYHLNNCLCYCLGEATQARCYGSCYYLNNCRGYADTIINSYAGIYQHCYDGVINCVAILPENSGTYGFSYCYGVTLCKTNTDFYESHHSRTVVRGGNTQAVQHWCADDARHGFNSILSNDDLMVDFIHQEVENLISNR